MPRLRLPLVLLILLPLGLLGCGGGGGGGGDDAALPAGGSWIAADPGPGFDYAKGMAATSDDATFVCGWFPSTQIWNESKPGETIRTAVALNDGYVCKYDAAGGLVWMQQILGTDYVEPEEVVALPDGSCVVAGNTSGVTVFAPLDPEQTTIDTADVLFIARYLADGTLAWVRTVPGVNSISDVRGMCVFPDDSIGICGLFAGTATFGTGEVTETSLSSSGGWSAYAARYAADGELIWAVAPTGGDGYAGTSGITALADGTAVIVGFFAATKTFGDGTPGEETFTATGTDDGFVARLATDGSLVWARHLAGDGRELPYGAATLPNGTVAIFGSFTDASLALSEGENDGQTITGSPDGNSFICRYSAGGSPVWWTHIAHAAGAFLNKAGIVAYPDNSIGVAALGPGTVTVDPGGPDQAVLPAFDLSDLFLARYGADGRVMWARRDGGVGSMVRAEGIAGYADGSLGFAGGYQGSFTVDHGGPGETTFPGDQGEERLVIRYNPDGSHDG